MKLLRIVALTLAATASGFATASPEAWEHADREYEANHFATALDAYQQLAANGDARAAEVAGHMLVAGESLYGEAVRSDPVKALALLRQAARAGLPVASYLIRNVPSDAPASLAAK
jgi:TPR repeat protein